MILRRRILRPEDSSLKVFFARSILRRIILLLKKSLEAANSSPENSSPKDIFHKGRIFEFLQKNQEGGDFRVGQKSLCLSQKFKK
jgi:hypothetical protein